VRRRATNTGARRRAGRAATLLLAGTLATGAARAQQPAPKVALIDVQGNQFLQKDTLLFYVSTRPGDDYDERRLRDDFRRLWETGFLDDMSLDVRDAPAGKVVTFVVRERKRIQVVDYRGSKALTATNIDDELKKRDRQLRIDTFYDIAKARQVEGVIKEMLAGKGRPFAAVRHDARNIGTSGTQVSFIIEDGPKARVKSIEFSGNQVFSDGALRKRMKKIKPAGFFNLSWLGGKSTWSEEKWASPTEGDKARLQDHYLDHGYVTATIGEPRITYKDGGSKKKPVKWMHIDIPVTEGEQYRVGEVKFEGLTVFKEEALRPLFKLQTGDVYRESRIRKAFEKLRDYYGSQGYFQWTGLTQRHPDPDRKVVDVTLTMEEDKRYYVGQIHFTGNDSTRDKVIRREVYLTEGDVFNTEALKLSVKRINQLGYFKPMEGAPEFSLSPKSEDHLDVTFKVEEQNRNQFTFGGGVSGLEGTFINASFQTANFLGLGETFQIAAQTGKRTKNYQVAITEPYLFDRPITAGIDLFKRKLTYESFGNVQGYVDDRTGLGLVAGFAVGRFSRLFTNYNFEVVDLRQLPVDAAFTGTPTTPLFDPTLFGIAQGRESRFTPSFVYNTVDNPWTPRSGVRLTLSNVFAGGPLGGNLDYLRPSVEAIWYIPHTRRTALGLRVDTSFIRQYGDTETLPYYLRFFLGGETQVRGYNIRAVGPVDYDRAQPVALGGNKYFLFNTEYYVDIAGPLRGLLFFDAGQAFLEGQGINLRRLRISTGAEIRFLMPVLNVPFRLIWALNPNRDPRDIFTPRKTFKFAIGTTF
jgi:outer membrane protein insertion porin family